MPTINRILFKKFTYPNFFSQDLYRFSTSFLKLDIPSFLFERAWIWRFLMVSLDCASFLNLCSHTLQPFCQKLTPYLEDLSPLFEFYLIKANIYCLYQLTRFSNASLYFVGVNNSRSFLVKRSVIKKWI